MTSVSVIIPCFNAALTLPLQLKALAEQVDAPEFEVLVVDNGSTDNVESVVRALQVPAGMTVRLLSAPDRQGAGYARNVGIREAAADLLMFCDADDVVSRWWLAHALRTFEVADLWSGSCIPLPDPVFSQPLETIRRSFGDSSTWQQPVEEQGDTAFPVLMGGNFGARRTVMVALGGFDAAAPTGGEDNDLGIRAQAVGYPAVTCKATRIGYRNRPTPAAVHHNAVSAARAHAQLAQRYGLWPRSHFRHWPTDLLKALAAHCRQLMQPKARRDTDATKLRMAVAWSVGSSRVAYRLGRQLPEPQVGLGLID